MMPHEWDKSHPKELTPKELRDLECRELLESKMMREQLNSNENKTSVPVTNQPSDKILAASNPSKHVPQKFQEVTPGFKPITNKKELATLMGTDAELIEIVSSDT